MLYYKRSEFSGITAKAQKYTQSVLFYCHIDYFEGHGIQHVMILEGRGSTLVEPQTFCTPVESSNH